MNKPWIVTRIPRPIGLNPIIRPAVRNATRFRTRWAAERHAERLRRDGWMIDVEHEAPT